MKVTFNFESIHDEVSFDQFYDELEKFCEEVLPYGDAVAFEVDRLYDERVLVSLIHDWYQLNSLFDEISSDPKYSDSYRDSVMHEWGVVAQTIAVLF